MAWIDDRIYAHPKWLAISLAARGVYASGLAYASGWSTGGRLDQGALRMIECTPRLRRELVQAGLWDDVDGKTIAVHDWDDHNSARDERKRKERERKREARRSGRWKEHDRGAGRGAPQSADGAADGAQDNGRPNVRPVPAPECVEGVKSEERPTRAVTSKADPTRANGEQPFDFELDQLLRDMP